MFTIPISFLLKVLNIYGPSPSSVAQIGTTWCGTNVKACKTKILHRNGMLIVCHIFPVIVWMAELVLPVIREVIQYCWTVCADRYDSRVGVSHSIAPNHECVCEYDQEHFHLCYAYLLCYVPGHTGEYDEVR